MDRGAGADDPARILTSDPFAARHSIALGRDWPRRCVGWRCGVRHLRPITAVKQRVVLAALLLSAGRVVGVDELAEAVWGIAVPVSARATLGNYVRRLRRALGNGRGCISTQPNGYLISVGSGELDVGLF
jgi:hypothetical protein